jgi:heme/copper-type cytochrome/quinol oxidase subunit 2
MAHGKSQRDEATLTIFLLISGIVMLVAFAIFSLPKIFKARNSLANNQTVAADTIKSATILLVVGIVLDAIAIAFSGWCFYPSGTE